jgi:hypothetical protein
MSFSALTCITFTGTTPLGPTIYFYSNLDGFISSFGNAPLLSLVGENCPYTITGIPDGTTTIRLKDPTTNCCVDIPIDSTLDLCIFCDFGFDIYSATTVSEIIAGDLTGACDSNITDYLINWYGPGIGSTNVAFTSGKGSEFSYTWTHPLTGNSAILVESGVYTPKVESVVINGTPLYDDLGAIGECFTPVTVQPFTCLNGTEVGNYSHILTFSNVAGETPQPLSSNFLIDSTTNYFAWSFAGFSVADTLRIYYSGANYTNPILIENIEIGFSPLPTNLSPNVNPKSASTGNFDVFYAKVTCLTAFTYSSGDILILEVIPNPTNTNTNWTLKFECLEVFDCTNCIFDTPLYKIVESSITGITGTCNTLNVSYSVSGCSFSTNNSFDIFKYFIPTEADVIGNLQLRSRIDTSDFNNLRNISNQLYYSTISCFGYQPIYEPYICFNPHNNSTISLKTFLLNSNQRKFELRFSDINDFDAYMNTLNAALVYSGSTNPLTLEYYRELRLGVPTPQGSIPCGDTTIPLSYNIHPSSMVVMTGTSAPPENYTLDITATTISKQINFDVCDNYCNSGLNDIVNNINETVTATTTNFTGTTTAGSRYVTPFYLIFGIQSGSTSNTNQTDNGFIIIPQYTNETYAFSGNPLTSIPSLSARTCNNLESFMSYESNNFGVGAGGTYQRYQYYYKVELTNPSDVRDFRIYASPITNGLPTFSSTDFVYGFSGGSVYHTNPTYLI